MDSFLQQLSKKTAASTCLLPEVMNEEVQDGFEISRTRPGVVWTPIIIKEELSLKKSRF